jgi:hypothetical protein
VVGYRGPARVDFWQEVIDEKRHDGRTPAVAGGRRAGQRLEPDHADLLRKGVALVLREVMEVELARLAEGYE